MVRSYLRRQISNANSRKTLASSRSWLAALTSHVLRIYPGSHHDCDSTRLRNGYRAEGLAVLLGGIFNTFPYTGFSQNVGLVKLSGIKKRLPIYYAAGFLVLLGLLPKFGALAQIIPSSVLGGAMLVMFGFVSIQGMQILARVDFANNEHNFLIAAVSIAAGVGLNNSNLFVSMPTAFQMFFSNGIVVASLLAIVLNAVLNHKKK